MSRSLILLWRHSLRGAVCIHPKGTWGMQLEQSLLAAQGTATSALEESVPQQLHQKLVPDA